MDRHQLAQALLGAMVREMVERVAENVTGGVIEASGHFLPEESPRDFVRTLLKTLAQAHFDDD